MWEFYLSKKKIETVGSSPQQDLPGTTIQFFV